MLWTELKLGSFSPMESDRFRDQTHTNYGVQFHLIAKSIKLNQTQSVDFWMWISYTGIELSKLQAYLSLGLYQVLPIILKVGLPKLFS